MDEAAKTAKIRVKIQSAGADEAPMPQVKVLSSEPLNVLEKDDVTWEFSGFPAHMKPALVFEEDCREIPFKEVILDDDRKDSGKGRLSLRAKGFRVPGGVPPGRPLRYRFGARTEKFDGFPVLIELRYASAGAESYESAEEESEHNWDLVPQAAPSGRGKVTHTIYVDVTQDTSVIASVESLIGPSPSQAAAARWIDKSQTVVPPAPKPSTEPIPDPSEVSVEELPVDKGDTVVWEIDGIIADGMTPGLLFAAACGHIPFESIELEPKTGGPLRSLTGIGFQPAAGTRPDAVLKYQYSGQLSEGDGSAVIELPYGNNQRVGGLSGSGHPKRVL